MRGEYFKYILSSGDRSIEVCSESALPLSLDPLGEKCEKVGNSREYFVILLFSNCCSDFVYVKARFWRRLGRRRLPSTSLCHFLARFCALERPTFPSPPIIIHAVRCGEVVVIEQLRKEASKKERAAQILYVYLQGRARRGIWLDQPTATSLVRAATATGELSVLSGTLRNLLSLQKNTFSLILSLKKKDEKPNYLLEIEHRQNRNANISN